ncbi:MAG: sugar phosphate isomerase/epimerase [Candidatus Nanohaloarchaea archaeon]|nr:sugar phosphate isomerase/epimerase [Candidatus Nanohaloarchaea archaeon]
MKLAGKTAPEPDELDRLHAAGFQHAELYLESYHLDSYERTVEIIEEAETEVVAVHTPHVPASQQEYLEKASFLAERCGALLVLHSTSLFLDDAINIGEELAYPHIAYEHNPGFSRRAIQNMILGRGKDLVLDAAHLYIASEQFRDDFEALLDVASHVHISDATTIRDGLPFGEGELDVDAMIETVAASSYDGYTVLEVMPKHQEQALRRVREVLGDADG